QQLIAHAAVEGFDIAVLHRLSGRDVVPFDTVILRPGKDGVRGELGPVIRNYHVRLAATADQIGQFTCHPTTGDRCVRDRGQALARDVIDDVEHAKAPPAGELVVHEVQGPARV